jgi:hypothetical protein
VPNYFDSNIIVTGPDRAVVRFRENCFIRDVYGQFNFSLNSFVPEPECLRDLQPTSDSELALIGLGVDPEPVHQFVLTLERVLALDWAKEQGITSRAALLRYVEKHSPEAVVVARRQLAAFAETGFYDRHQWRSANWSTIRSPEWTNIQSEERGRLVFGFSTAWSFPHSAFRVLGALHPNLTFDIAALDVDLRWALVGMVKGTSMVLRDAHDFDSVHERVHGRRVDDDLLSEDSEPLRLEASV